MRRSEPVRKAVPPLGPFWGLLVFILALYVLDHALRGFEYHDLGRWLRAMPEWRLLAALLLTGAGYLTLSGYDTLAFRYIGKTLPYPKILLTSFIGYAVTNNIGGGFSLLAGGSIRYRLYGAWSASGLEVGQIIAFNVLTFWLGFLFVGGLIFLLTPAPFPSGPVPPWASTPLLGALFLAFLGLYLYWIGAGKSLKIRGWEVRPAPLPLTLAQIGMSALDWSLAATALYVLLPPIPGLSWPLFLSFFLLAQLGGLLSQTPGGLGVFEALAVLLLQPFLPAPAVLTSLILFRGIYYLLPLGLAALLLAIHELATRKGMFVLSRTARQRMAGLAPPIFSLLTFAGGALLLFSGATPALHSRMAWLRGMFPLPVVEVSHFLSSLTGLALLVLARGLWERLDAAFFLSTLLLGAGAVLSLLKRLDYEEACILLALLSHSEKYARTQLGNAAAMIKEADRLMAQAITMVADLYDRGIIKPEEGKPAYPDLLTFYDTMTPVEQILYVMFLEHRMRAFQGAFHMNPDYVTWYGLAEMKKDLVEIRHEAERMISEAGRS